MIARSNSSPFLPKRGRAADWPRDRIARLDKAGIMRLRDNAERLGEPELAQLCAEVLKELGSAAAKKRIAAQRAAKAR